MFERDAAVGAGIVERHLAVFDEKEAVAREAAARTRRDLLAAVRNAVEKCVAVLKSRDASQMAQLYPEATPEDRTNKQQLLSLMRQSAARLTIFGSPTVEEPEIDGESARTDFTAHLTWRGHFAGSVNRATTFRAMIASIGPEPQIGCRIVGKANLQ